MFFFRQWRQVGPVAIVLLLVAELLVDLAHDMVPSFAGTSHRHLWLDLAQLGTTLVVLALAARRVRQTVRFQRRQSRHYARLAELGNAAFCETDVNKILQRGVTLLVDVLKCDAAAFVQSDPEAKRWRKRATAGRYAAQLPKESELPWGPGFFGDYVLHTTAQPVHVLKLGREHRFVVPEMFKSLFTSAVAIRIHLESQNHGVLIAMFRKPTRCDVHCSSYLRSLGLLLTRYLQTHQTTRALKDSQALFLQLAEHVEDVFYVANADGSKVHYISPAYEKTWQASSAALYKKNSSAWLDAIHEDDREEAAKMLRDHALGNYFERTYRVVRADGTVRWICDRSFPIHDVDGDGKMRVAGLATDITEVRHAQDIANQLMLSNERTARVKAETHIRTRDEVLAIVSHDLRTPLNSISMAAQRLMKQCKDDSKSVQLAGRIESAVGRMERLVQDLLEVSRLESGVLRLERRDTTLKEFWQEAADAFESAAGKAAVVFVPIDTQTLMPCVNSMRILQALGNLISNATTFTPPDGQVKVSVSPDAGGLLFCVEDTGPGIDSEQIERLFEPFWQGAQHDKRGLGLGLHIARGIIEAHGGKIGARSTDPHGTVVWFSLPADMVEAGALEVREVPAMDATLN